MLSAPAVIRIEKRCSRCKEVKPVEEFSINKSNADWRGTKCKPCAVIASAEWRKKNPERSRQHSYNQFLRDRQKPSEERWKYARRYRETHQEIMSARTKAWKEKNRAHFNAYMLRKHKERYASDPDYRFSIKVRTKMRLLMRGHRKSAPTEQLLGCKIEDFKKYLELQWEPWMSWENYGNKDGCWVIDHIIPVEAFDLSKPEDQRCCFHYSNMRPLCRDKNREKWYQFQQADLDALRKRVLCLSG